MILTRFVVCSQRRKKPVTRLVCDSRPQAEKALQDIRRQDQADPETDYWIAELGPETEAWRWLAATND